MKGDVKIWAITKAQMAAVVAISRKAERHKVRQQRESRKENNDFGGWN